MSVGRQRTLAKRSLLWLGLLGGLLIWAFGWPSPVAAGGPDYSLPGRLALPWACDQGYRVTWTPADHWANGKTVGLAFDFSLPEGTPLYAPADGMAYFLRDERSPERGLGHYVDLVVEGEWLVRLAHLRDERSGRQEVRAGELLGYSGSSGASAAHLHLELLVREDKAWVRPDLARLERLFGLPITALVRGGLIVNEDCPARLAVEGAVHPVHDPLPLGETVELELKLRNEGLKAIVLNAVQLALQPPEGEVVVAEIQGEWSIAGKTSQALLIPARPNMPGTWQVRHITCRTKEDSHTLPAEGSFTVEPSPLRLVGIVVRPAFEVGEHLELEVWVEHDGDAELTIDDLYVEGLQPDGLPWTASLGAPAILRQRSLSRFLLQSSTVPTRIGQWRITRVGYRQGKHLLYLARTSESFAVWGPELRVVRTAVYTTPKSLDVFLIVSNVGTRPAILDALEIWISQPGSQEPLSIQNTVLRQLEPGRSALIRLARTLDSAAGSWHVVEAGYWARGIYYRLALPDQAEKAIQSDKPSS